MSARARRACAWLGLAALLGCIGGTAPLASPPAPAASVRYENPILPGFYPDPSICRVGADYYLVTSSFEYFPGIPIFHSRDLVHWRQLGHVLARPSQLSLAGIASSQGIFAPTIREHDGTFYVVSTNVSGGGSFLVTARDPAGPWSDPIWIHEAEFTMDPSLSFTPDGRALYLRHGGGEHGGAYQAELDLATGRLLGEPQLLWRGTGGIWPEGPHLYAIDGRQYLLLAEGGTSTGHRVTIARSQSPYGPFEPDPDNPVLTHADRPEEPIQATGHADLVQTEAGDWWMVLLGIAHLRRPSATSFPRPDERRSGFRAGLQRGACGPRATGQRGQPLRAGALGRRRRAAGAAVDARGGAFDAGRGPRRGGRSRRAVDRGSCRSL